MPRWFWKKFWKYSLLVWSLMHCFEYAVRKSHCILKTDFYFLKEFCKIFIIVLLMPFFFFFLFPPFILDKKVPEKCVTFSCIGFILFQWFLFLFQWYFCILKGEGLYTETNHISSHLYMDFLGIIQVLCPLRFVNIFWVQSQKPTKQNWFVVF